jgi:hypothetical protein
MRNVPDKYFVEKIDTNIYVQPHYGPGVDSASNKNEYQEYFLGVKTTDA